MGKEITIYDIASALNLSAATVSRALNDHPAINASTKNIIGDKAKEMGYRSNKFARNLRKQKTHTIGVIVPRLNSYFMSTVLAGMEEVANDAGFNLLISQSLESEKKEIVNATTLFNSRVDALLVSISYDTEGFNHFQVFIDKGIPIIFFDRVTNALPCTNIVIDNAKAGYEATKHLIEQGCTRIVHATGNLKRNVYAERLNGYQQALHENDIEFDSRLLIETALSMDSGGEVVNQILKMKDRPDALFCANDTCAVSTISLLKKKGIQVPADIAVVGFNNDPIASVIEPNLTTIHYPGKEMGKIAAQNIIHQLNGSSNPLPTSTIILQSELIIRESSLKK